VRLSPAESLDLSKPGPRRPGRAEWRRFLDSRRAVIGALLLLALGLGSLLAPVLAPDLPDRQAPGAAIQPPSWRHPLGTDAFGRDVLSRTLWGGRVSQLVGVLSTAVSVAVGVAVGAVAGYRGGAADSALTRLTEAVATFPTVFLLITLVAVFGASVPLLIMALGLTSWPVTARLVRAEFLALREREFVRAAGALGAGVARLICRHILPNVVPLIIVAASLRVAHAILIEAGLSYLGLGVPAPRASWGGMVADGREHVFHAWWMSFFPGLCIFLTVMGYNLVGDGLRDALDPRAR
jgi:peptide/nickel transport system permease protein